MTSAIGHGNATTVYLVFLEPSHHTMRKPSDSEDYTEKNPDSQPISQVWVMLKVGSLSPTALPSPCPIKPHRWHCIKQKQVLRPIQIEDLGAKTNYCCYFKTLSLGVLCYVAIEHSYYITLSKKTTSSNSDLIFLKLKYVTICPPKRFLINNACYLQIILNWDL